MSASLEPTDGESTTGLRPHVASALAYVAGPLSGLLILVAEGSNARVRFHAWQSILALGVLWATGLLLYVIAFASIFVSANALFVLLAIAALVWTGSVVLAVVFIVRAYQGRRWKAPFVGERAERYAAKKGMKEEG